MNPNRPLTAKQAAFVQHVANGYSLADSYRSAYNSSGTSGTVRVEASRLMKQPHIVAALHRQRLAQEREHLRELRRLAKSLKL
jgi:phage terminase small subunit